MNLVEIARFASRIRQLRERYEAQDLSRLEQDFATRTNQALTAVRGKGREIANEAQARAYIISPILNELGWDVATPTKIVVEDPVSPQSSAEHCRFLDYHGREQTEDGGRSLLIVEAKRPSAQLPEFPLAELPHMFARELHAVAAGKIDACKFSSEWQGWLKRLIDYAARSSKQFGKIPERAVITTGDWFLIFTQVSATLLAENPEPASIVIFADLTELESRATEFFLLLNYEDLSGHIPPQHPTALAEYVAKGVEVSCALLTEVSHVRHGARQPSIACRVAARVRTPKGAWLIVHLTYDEDFIALSWGSADLQRALEKLEERSESLISEIAKHAKIKLITPKEYAASQDEPSLSSDFAIVSLEVV